MKLGRQCLPSSHLYLIFFDFYKISKLIHFFFLFILLLIQFFYDKSSFVAFDSRLPGLPKIFPICGNDLLIPIKAVLPDSLPRSLPPIIYVHINIPVTFAHFPLGAANDVDRRPAGIRKDLCPIANCLPQCLNMASQIVHAVCIMYTAILFHFIQAAKAIPPASASWPIRGKCARTHIWRHLYGAGQRIR